MSTPSRRHARPVAGRPAVQPHPLANLPRPLSERERGRRRVTPMRIGLLVGAIGLLAGAALTAGSLGVPALDPVGDVAGAVATGAPSPTPTARVDVAPAASPRPTATPIPTPTPVPTPAPVTSLTGYVSPLPNGRLTLPFGPSPWGSRVVDGELFHDGIDLATFCGDRVVAAHAGTVLAAGRKYDAHIGWVGDLQPYLDRLERKHLWITLPIVVVIDDGNGYRSIYAHFGKVVVKRGDVVEAGELIGYEGQTGRASGCHLHYGLFSPLETATFAIDPDVVKRMKVPALELARVDPLIVLPMHAPKPKPTPPPSIDPNASAGATPGVLPSPSALATAAPTP